MIFFKSDYSQGAHPKVMDALIKTNEEHTDGYALDAHCEHAAEMIKKMIGRDDCEVFMMIGGTHSNVITIASALEPYEAVVTPRTGHIYAHECGAVEATGHKIIPMDCPDGKLTSALIDKAWTEYEDEHTAIPRMAYISNVTETGTVYTKAQLLDVSRACKKHNMYLYMDGARLGAALTSPGSDLTIKDIAQNVDAFYIGGTKNGALLGEAVIVFNDKIKDHYRWMIKRNCGMLAKGRLIGVQFEALLEGGEDSVLYQIGRHENEMGKRLRDGIASLGYSFDSESASNIVFPIIPAETVKELSKDFFFTDYGPADADEHVLRLVTSWGTKESEVDAFIDALRKLK